MFRDKLKSIVEEKKEEGNDKKKIENLVFFIVLLIITVVVINIVWNGNKVTKNTETNSTSKQLASNIDFETNKIERRYN